MPSGGVGIDSEYVNLKDPKSSVMSSVGMGGGSNGMKHYAKLMLGRIERGCLSKAAPVAVAGFHSDTRQPSAESKFEAVNFTLSYFVPTAVKAVLELGIPDILAKADGGKSLSAPQILAKLPTKSTPGPNSFTNLRRLLRPLVQEGFFTETLNSEKEPTYGLTEISKWYVRDNEFCFAQYADLMFSRPIGQAMFHRMHEVILDEDATPFAVEHGKQFYPFWQKNAAFGAVFENGMISVTKPDVKEVVDTLQDSGWLEGAKTFVDVAGGVAGVVVAEVVARHPHIEGINFDQPHVLEGAPEVKGVRFVGGDFHKSIPSADFLFMKGVTHNYDDETCIKILKNCFEALSEGGKMIVAEWLVNYSDKGTKATFVTYVDMCMLGVLKGARERTKEEIQHIMKAAGFSQFSVMESQTGPDLIMGMKL